MNESILNFLKNNQELLESNNFEELYTKALREWISIGELTQTFYHADIDPLKYMNNIPKKYLFIADNVDGFKIPNNIRNIGELAFYKTDISSIEIPEGVEYIASKCFSCCDNLIFVSLPLSLNRVGKSIFGASPVVSEVRYAGTIEDWNKVQKDKQWVSLSGQISFNLICKDGEVWTN